MRSLLKFLIFFGVFAALLQVSIAGSCSFVRESAETRLLATDSAWFYQSGLGIRIVPSSSPIENSEFQVDVLVDSVAEYLPFPGEKCMSAGLAPFFENDRATLIHSLNLSLCECDLTAYTAFPRPHIAEQRWNVSTDCSAVSGYESFSMTFTVKYANGSYADVFPGSPTTRNQPLFYNHTAEIAFVAFELYGWPWHPDHLSENTVVSLDYRAKLSFAEPVAIYSETTEIGSLLSVAVENARANATMFFDRGYLVDGVTYLPTATPVTKYLDPTPLPLGFELPVQKPFCTRVPLDGGGYSPFVKWTHIEYDPYLVAVFVSVPDESVPEKKGNKNLAKTIVPAVLCSVALLVAVFLILALKVPAIGKKIIPAAHKEALAK